MAEQARPETGGPRSLVAVLQGVAHAW